MHNIAFGIIISLLVVSLVILFCIILIKLYIQKIKKYNEIIYQKEIDHQISLNQTVLETQEQTLQHISQELHDDAGQQITCINFQLENLKLDFPALVNNVVPISHSITNLSSSIRQLSHSLNNQIFSQQNLVKAIQIEIERLNSHKEIQITFINNLQNFIHFSTYEKIVVYRVFQECLNNIFKYAEASKIEIILDETPNFVMTISDNGNGFDVEKEINSTISNGLKNIKSRAEIINYSVQIASKISQGTTIILKKN